MFLSGHWVLFALFVYMFSLFAMTNGFFRINDTNWLVQLIAEQYKKAVLQNLKKYFFLFTFQKFLKQKNGMAVLWMLFMLIKHLSVLFPFHILRRLHFICMCFSSISASVSFPINIWRRQMNENPIICGSFFPYKAHYWLFHYIKKPSHI